MKLTKVTLLSVTILAILLIGVVAFTAFSATKDLKLKVKWRPPTYTLGNPLPNPWNCEIFFAPARDLNEIDTNTILMEGLYPPSGTPYLLSGAPPRLAVPFSGYDVITALLSKSPHLAPGTYHILLQISGNLKPEYGGNAFSGEGGIDLVVPDPSPP